ncbi:hypothetical protein BVY01_04760 [bacterium I07]|nr:hypothetical protein BVY01_04760 [bacterium I07]
MNPPGKSTDFIVWIGIGIITIVYLLTLAPSVLQIDSGELAAVQSTLGIAHPTGYPLFTLIGFLFSKLPLGLSKIVQLNLLSAIYCVLGIWFFIKMTRLLLQSLYRKPFFSEPWMTFSALTGGFMLAFSGKYWIQSSSVEVYSLHLFLINLFLYLIVRNYLTAETRAWLWIRSAIVLGLMLSNHMTSILVLPGLVFILMLKLRNGLRLHVLGFCFLAACAVIVILYLYLPIRAHSTPVLNWGNPVTFQNFWNHVLGKQYRGWLFSSSEIAIKNLKQYFIDLPVEFAVAGFVLGLWGCYQNMKMHKKIAVFFMISFFFTVLYASNYDIHDLDSYFLLAHIIFSLWIAVGAAGLFSLIPAAAYRKAAAACLILICCAQAYSHFSKADQHKTWIYHDYTKAALNSLPRNAVLMSYQWDYLISPAYYFQFVEKLRPDVAIVDKELLRRSWYFDQLHHHYPAITENVRSIINDFKKALEPFEKGKSFDPNRLEKLYRLLMTRLIDENLKDRAVFLAPELIDNELRHGELQLPDGCRLIPDLFFFRVVKSNDYVPVKTHDVTIRLPEKDTVYSSRIKRFLFQMWSRRALYEHQNGQPGSNRLLNLLYKHFPDSPLPSALQAIMPR